MVGKGVDVNEVLGVKSPYPDELEIAIPDKVSPTDVRAVIKSDRSILNPNYSKDNY